MGFLSKLISKEVSKQLGNVISSAVNQAVNNTAGNNSASAPAPASAPAAAPNQGRVYNFGQPMELKKVHNEPFSTVINVVPSTVAINGKVAFEQNRLIEYISDLLIKNIPQITVRTNVSPAELGLNVLGKQQNVSIVVYRGNIPVLALLVIDQDLYRRASVINTMNGCEDKGIPAIRFMEGFLSYPEYVVARCRAVMK